MIAVAATAVTISDLHLISADPVDAFHVLLIIHVAALPDDSLFAFHSLDDFAAGLRFIRRHNVVALDDVVVPIDRVAKMPPGSRGVTHITADVERGGGMNKC